MQSDLWSTLFAKSLLADIINLRVNDSVLFIDKCYLGKLVQTMIYTETQLWSTLISLKLSTSSVRKIWKWYYSTVEIKKKCLQLMYFNYDQKGHHFVGFCLFHSSVIMFVLCCCTWYLHYAISFLFNCALNNHGCRCPIKRHISIFIYHQHCIAGTRLRCAFLRLKQRFKIV